MLARLRRGCATGCARTGPSSGRTVRYLAAKAGIRQFLDLGTGIPSADNTHEVAQGVAPDSRVVYVDNDPIVLRHAQALMRGTREGATIYIEADLRDPGRSWSRRRRRWTSASRSRSCCSASCTWSATTRTRGRSWRGLMDAVPPGSYLVISHPALDIGEGQAAAQRAYNQNVATAQTLRTRDEFARFFTGLELVEPGLVQVHQWHPDPDDSAPESTVWAHGGVARKAGRPGGAQSPVAPSISSRRMSACPMCRACSLMMCT